MDCAVIVSLAKITIDINNKGANGSNGIDIAEMMNIGKRLRAPVSGGLSFNLLKCYPGNLLHACMELLWLPDKRGWFA